MFETLQLRLELAVRCAAALAADPTAAAGIVRHRVLTGSVVGSNGVPIQAEQLSEAAEFLAGQMATLHQVRWLSALCMQLVMGWFWSNDVFLYISTAGVRVASASTLQTPDLLDEAVDVLFPGTQT